MNNRSPWIHQLDHARESRRLAEDLVTDVAVVGAGIAGVATSFFLLKHTNKKVVLIEGYKLAHGATGHNAGQLVASFERPLHSIVEEFGLEKTVQGLQDVESAWGLLEEIYTEAGLDISKFRFEGYDGLANIEKVLEHLRMLEIRKMGGLPFYKLSVYEDWEGLKNIPDKYHSLMTLASREEISLKLETFDPQYIAYLPRQKGVMNSALFCQEVVAYLVSKYPERLAFYEHTLINKVVVHDDKIILDAINHTVECGRVVLCTNGFEGLDIITHEGLSINSRFHHNVNGVVAFMAGYLEHLSNRPTVLLYSQKEDPGITDNPGDPYFYVTRRPYKYEHGVMHDLVCVGGPDFALDDRLQYDRELEFSEKSKSDITRFIQKTYDKKEDLEYRFLWHGLMGYTKNMLRMVGPDPKCPSLFYNLGCNGIGLLPSIFGGWKVAWQIAGEKFPPSIFDIPNKVE